MLLSNLVFSEGHHKPDYPAGREIHSTEGLRELFLQPADMKATAVTLKP